MDAETLAKTSEIKKHPVLSGLSAEDWELICKRLIKEVQYKNQNSFMDVFFLDFIRNFYVKNTYPLLWNMKDFVQFHNCMMKSFDLPFKDVPKYIHFPLPGIKKNSKEDKSTEFLRKSVLIFRLEKGI